MNFDLPTATLDILFSDGTQFTYRVAFAFACTSIAEIGAAPKERARMFDRLGDVTKKWE